MYLIISNKNYCMPDHITLSSKIYELRKGLKLTQAQLGEKVGVSGGAISQFEKALTKPTPETLKLLSGVLGFDFSKAVHVKEAPITNSDLSAARLMLQKVNSPEWKAHIGTYFPGQMRQDGVRIYYDLSVLRQYDFIDFLLSGAKKPEEYLTAATFILPGLDYAKAVVLEIQGNSMAPRYPDSARYVLFPVEEEHWQYATGVHAMLLKNNKFLFKRIVSNKAGTLLLNSDATGDQTTIELLDIASLWKAGQAVHMPPEEI